MAGQSQREFTFPQHLSIKTHPSLWLGMTCMLCASALACTATVPAKACWHPVWTLQVQCKSFQVCQLMAQCCICGGHRVTIPVKISFPITRNAARLGICSELVARSAEKFLVDPLAQKAQRLGGSGSLQDRNKLLVTGKL